MNEHTNKTKPEQPLTDSEILAGAQEVTRQVGATAERAVYVLDQSGVVMQPHEVAAARHDHDPATR